MEWYYKCPKCGVWRGIRWNKIDEVRECHNTKQNYYPPTPALQHDAYVDTHNWPKEMENEVVRLRGNKCTVPGCTKNAQTLDHRLAWAKGGKTCVDNLFPMCNEHNQAKGDTDYNIWLSTNQ